MQRRNGWMCSFALIGTLVVGVRGVRAAVPAGLSEVNLGDAARLAMTAPAQATTNPSTSDRLCPASASNDMELARKP